jgi:hypothetical protein
MMRSTTAAALVALSGCASALTGSAATGLPAPETAAPQRPVADLLDEARASWSQRPDAAAVARARDLYLQAAAADRAGTEGLWGAIVAELWLARRERAASARAARAVSAVRLGEECVRRAPESAVCDYGLALALGVQAQERPSTARDGLKLMVERLRRAASRDPGFDDSGPERVLALVLLRAPGWPLGPGDPEAGLDVARSAANRSPSHPPNQLALAEALVANGAADAGKAAAERALALAEERADTGDPDAQGWIDEARQILAAASAGGPSPAW